MKEREATRKYLIELIAAMSLYLAAVCGSVFVAKRMDDGILRTLLLVTPVIPVVLAVWAVARQFRRMDEFVRLRSLESIAIAAAITMGLTLTYGFLESAGFPRLSMIWVFPVLCFTWGVHSGLRCALSR
jgi:hypothetical protein